MTVFGCLPRKNDARLPTVSKGAHKPKGIPRYAVVEALLPDPSVGDQSRPPVLLERGFLTAHFTPIQTSSLSHSNKLSEDNDGLIAGPSLCRKARLFVNSLGWTPAWVLGKIRSALCARLVDIQRCEHGPSSKAS